MHRHVKRTIGLPLLLAASITVALGLSVQESSAVPWNTHRTVVQPGARILGVDQQRWCTVGFLLHDTAGATYFVTGAQCPPTWTGDGSKFIRTGFDGVRAWAPGKGPAVTGYVPRPKTVAHFVLQSRPTDVNGIDYAIARLEPKIPFSGAIAVNGGPVAAVYTGETTSLTPVTWVCHDNYSDFGLEKATYDDGVHSDEALRGLLRRHFNLAGAANGECAGSPVTALNGPVAVGILDGVTATGVNPSNPSQFGGAPVVRLDAIIADAQRYLHTKLTLLSAARHGIAR